MQRSTKIDWKARNIVKIFAVGGGQGRPVLCVFEKEHFFQWTGACEEVFEEEEMILL